MACGGGSNATPTPTLAPTATATTSGPGPPRPEAERIIEHIRALSVDIGARPSGSPKQEQAVAYAREQLERAGYVVEVQDFTAAVPDVYRPASVAALGETFAAASLANTAAGEISAPLVDTGTGRESDFPAAAAGAIVLIQRRDVPFVDMAARAEAAGAIGMVIANRSRGPFAAGLGDPSPLIAAGIGLEQGEALRAALADGPVTVTIRVEDPDPVAAHNVIARPASGRCRTVSGGHLDSVPWAPGAGDNASGSALVLELARAAAVAGLDGHCFALFGAEEFGLVGSAEFVARLTAAERDTLEVAYIYDIVGGEPEAFGTGTALDRVARPAGELGIDVATSTDFRSLGSDHLSFIEAGIPALLLTTPVFDNLHTIDDTLERLDTTRLVEMAQLAFALLEGAALPAPSP